jgi:hypothetical protein
VPDAPIPNSLKSSTVSFVLTFPLISLSRNTGSYRAEAPQQIPEVHSGAPTWRTRMLDPVKALGPVPGDTFGTLIKSRPNKLLILLALPREK